MDAVEVWELLAYIVTVFGLPFAILVFVHEQRKARENEEEQTWQLLSDGYTRFLELVISNPDLKMGSERATSGLTEEQQERALAMFAILVALFERAYLLAYEERMSGKKLRRWRSWEDYMREWCRRADFRSVLPDLLKGEDAEFAAYIGRLADEEDAARSAVRANPD